MSMALSWLRLDGRRRWRSLLVLMLLVALTTGTVLAAVAGARRGASAYDRLAARTLPATVTVLANQPGFDWSKVEALPEVAGTGLFVVYDGASAGFPGTELGYPPANAENFQAVERPVVTAGRMYDPRRADEVMASSNFMADHHLRVGDPLTIHLSSPQQGGTGFEADAGQPKGPLVTVHVVGAVRSPFWMDFPGDPGGVMPTYAFYQKYRLDIVGPDPLHTSSYTNAYIRLKGGEAQIPRFRADFARVTGRPDIDIWDNADVNGGPVHRATGYEAACLLAFGIAALLAALFLVGQAVARYASGTAGDLRVLQAVGLTRAQAAASAAVAPGLAALLGGGLGVAAAFVASRWMPLGVAAHAEPDPGFDADWLVLGTGWAIAVLAVAGGTALLTRSALTARKLWAAPRRSVVAAAAAAAALPVPAVIGARFAFEPGRGRSAVPVLPAIAGAVAGVLGLLAAFTFSAGISDASTHPERFGATWQLSAFYGLNGRDFGPAAQVSRAVAAQPEVTGFLDVRIGGGKANGLTVESYDYDPVDGKTMPVVLTSGAMPASPSQVVLAPTTAASLHARLGSVFTFTGGPAPRAMTVTGIGFVPNGPHNGDDEGAWMTPAGWDRVFSGAHYGFKFHTALVALRPGVDPETAAQALSATAGSVPGGKAFPFGPAQPPDTQQGLTDLQELPNSLGWFLALLAVVAVGYALVTAVRRRSHELAVLRALGLTSGQTGLVIVTQASLLALAGLAAGIPLGLLAGQAVWRIAADWIPLDYRPPFAPWPFILAVPAALVTANLLALWPGWRAARLRPAQVLRSE
jgi:hypothetical protein